MEQCAVAPSDARSEARRALFKVIPSIFRPMRGYHVAALMQLTRRL
jgi:hypothetical protein